MARGPSIVVGLDFGTTFSGIAWAFEGSVDELEVISAWPGGGNRTSVKVPSVISYDGQRTYWGYQVRPFTEAFRGVKLLLDESQETKYTPSLALKALLVKHKTNAVQVMADYLQYLVEYAKSVLQRRFGIPAKDMDLQFTLTVPAVWSDTAKDRTMNAAIKANIRPQDVTLVSEPEAAALYTLRSIQGNSSSKNDVFIVCDAGGGTVDLISYQIKTLEPLVLVEVTEGTGRICGSMLLDQRFEELLRDRMGVNYATLSSKSKEAALSYWQDRVKPNYTGKLDNDYADVDYFIPLPGVADDLTIPIEDGFFQLSSDDVEDIFEPIIHDVEELITEQVASITKRGFVTEAIVLVGGFGSSEYLLRRLQKENPTVTVLQPPNAWSAVVSGAVHRGLGGNQIERRVARRHYGIEFSTE
ncbi:Hsp70 family chaperone [Aspergillus arachidicola]|uniref:Hsp70 family chaperone n=1 Tax=Aspergillus arachidicola TaxID=656916 RepID=A0A2G7G6R1_9EURO|nr:Hsp70 family chaperone [Aspergillus arachidicola]